MKKNKLRAMENLDIDEGIRGLIGKLWNHGYRTLYSCEGHKCCDECEKGLGYVAYEKGTGDKWFETNAKSFGFDMMYEKDLCDIPRNKILRAISYHGNNCYDEKSKYKTGKVNLDAVA